MVQSHLSRATDAPLVLMGWLSLLALEDLPRFSDLTGVGAEHVIQSLLYRLRTRDASRNLNTAEEDVKVKSHTFLLITVVLESVVCASRLFPLCFALRKP